MIKFIGIILIFTAGFCLTSEEGQDHWANGMQIVEGDILLRDGQIMERNAVINDSQLWPNGVVVYDIGWKLWLFTWKIKRAMRHYEQNTCIRFKKRTDEKDYVKIYSGPKYTCFGEVGKIGGAQNLSLGYGCRHIGIILHELGHSLGLYHEHSRPDRDKYLNINKDNMAKAISHNFVKLHPNKTRIIGPFDYNSIMLYGEHDFSKDPGHLKVMTALKPGVTLKNPLYKGKLSEWDIKKINILYNCDSKEKKAFPLNTTRN